MPASVHNCPIKSCLKLVCYLEQFCTNEWCFLFSQFHLISWVSGNAVLHLQIWNASCEFKVKCKLNLDQTQADLFEVEILSHCWHSLGIFYSFACYKRWRQKPKMVFSEELTLSFSWEACFYFIFAIYFNGIKMLTWYLPLTVVYRSMSKNNNGSWRPCLQPGCTGTHCESRFSSVLSVRGFNEGEPGMTKQLFQRRELSESKESKLHSSSPS